MVDKFFKSHDQQMRLLRRRGLIVKTSAKRILEEENYYNVINGYKDLFLLSSAPNELYVRGSSFDEIYALYEFDRELRFIFLQRLLKIENNIKSAISYQFSKAYGHDNYLKLDNFMNYKNRDELLRVMSVISTVQSKIAGQTGKHNSVTHYITQYGYVPLWVLVNVLTFGEISRFYGIMKLIDRQAVARKFGIQENAFRSYLIVMSQFRNICAHEERLYNVKLYEKEIKSGHIHVSLMIPRGANNKYLYGINDVFALLICLKEFLPKQTRGEFADTVRQIENILHKLTRKLHSVNPNDITTVMGFPTNWKNILR